MDEQQAMVSGRAQIKTSRCPTSRYVTAYQSSMQRFTKGLLVTICKSRPLFTARRLLPVWGEPLRAEAKNTEQARKMSLSRCLALYLNLRDSPTGLLLRCVRFPEMCQNTVLGPEMFMPPRQAAALIPSALPLQISCIRHPPV